MKVEEFKNIEIGNKYVGNPGVLEKSPFGNYSQGFKPMEEPHEDYQNELIVTLFQSLPPESLRRVMENTMRSNFHKKEKLFDIIEECGGYEKYKEMCRYEREIRWTNDTDLTKDMKKFLVLQVRRFLEEDSLFFEEKFDRGSPNDYRPRRGLKYFTRRTNDCLDRESKTEEEFEIYRKLRKLKYKAYYSSVDS